MIFSLIIILPVATLVIITESLRVEPAARGKDMEVAAGANSNDPAVQQARQQLESQSWLQRRAVRYNSIERAQAELDKKQKDVKYRIHLPSRMPNEKALGFPIGIYVLNDSHVDMVKSSPEIMETADVSQLAFSNGVTLGVGFRTDKPLDYEQLVSLNQPTDDGIHTGLPKVVNLQGYKGWGLDYGYDYYPVINQKHYRGAFLEWTDDTARYCLRGPIDDETITLDKLMNIAASMY
jgi:hypothetical protein